MLLTDEHLLALGGLAVTVIAALWGWIRFYINQLLGVYKHSLEDCEKDRDDLKERVFGLFTRVDHLEKKVFPRRDDND